LQADEWNNIFTQARNIGVSFILLAGGEPLLRRDIITVASSYPEIIFPIFTNGTVVDEEYLNLFDQHRNLIPVVSIEGDDMQTDKRRGEGVSQQVLHTTNALQEKGILYGASITVTSENKDKVTQSEFITSLKRRGCGLLFFIEYVPVEDGTEKFILDDEQLKELQEKIDALRQDKHNKGMIMLSFPGDEEAMGGCLAAGRGFFHINPTGGAEPCPFSPYSELNIKEKTLLEILQSPFFEKVRQISASEALHHKGGCTLFQYEEEVASCVTAQ
jgi:MoaA/NifB/PqqE/SkfB family radical SAM enzyme